MKINEDFYNGLIVGWIFMLSIILVTLPYISLAPNAGINLQAAYTKKYLREHNCSCTSDTNTTTGTGIKTNQSLEDYNRRSLEKILNTTEYVHDKHKYVRGEYDCTEFTEHFLNISTEKGWKAKKVIARNRNKNNSYHAYVEMKIIIDPTRNIIHLTNRTNYKRIDEYD